VRVTRARNGSARSLRTRRARAVGFGCTSVFAVTLILAGAPPCRAAAHGFKLWPLIDYRNDPDTGEKHLHLLGPLFSYDADRDGWSWALRPLLYRKHTSEPVPDMLAVLYPLSVMRWSAGETNFRLLGLFSYQSRTPAKEREWERRLTIFPLLFYRYSKAEGRSLSLLPFYANLDDFFGYDHIRMVLFPGYLRLEKGLVERTWAPFPFVSWTGGLLGRGWRLWPVYGWEDVGESSRMRYVLWPLYVHAQRWPTRPERKDTLVLAPFYARIDSPHQHSRAYLGPFLTHTVDTKEQTETWGFPWPFWMSQRRLDTGARQSLRLAPFYQDRQQGDLHSRFYLWPVYRARDQETDAYRYSRRDLFLVLGRDIEEVNTDAHRHRQLQTLFPLFRRRVTNERDDFSTLALLDALVPTNETVADVYGPLWQLYRREDTAGELSRWSLLWNLVSSDGIRVRYPIDWE